MLAQFPAQTFGRIAAVLGEDEDKATFVRSSVLRELERRNERKRSARCRRARHDALPRG
jgi:hypothetical protein